MVLLHGKDGEEGAFSTAAAALQNMGVAAIGVAFTLLIIPAIPRLGLRNLQLFGFLLSAFMALVLAF